MKTRSILLFTFAALLLSFFVIQTPAQAAGTTASMAAKVLAFRLRVRDAGNLHGKLIVLAKFGDTLTVLGRNTGMTWLKVQTHDGKVGWVSAIWVRLQAHVLVKNLPVVS
jgi:hypothetical protein